LCAALAIDRKLDGTKLFDAGGELFIAVNPDVDEFRKKRGPIVTTTRIGITRAAHLHLRYYLGGSPFVSRHAPSPSPQSIARPAKKNPVRTKC